MRHRLKTVAGNFLPPHTSRRRVAARLARQLRLLPKGHPDIHYAEWVERTEPYIWSGLKELQFRPLISIIVPVYNSPAKYLMPMVYSVINQQNYDNWELVLVNASGDKYCRDLTKSCADIDSRIKVIEITENLGIAGNTDYGIKNARGDYIGLLDHDDILAPRALYEVARTLQSEPKPQLIYSDEDKLAENGEYRFDPFFKPDWSPYLLRHVNYLNHFVVIEKGLIKAAGGYQKGVEGAQDFDLFLRIVSRQPVIKHIPKILYHWRVAIGSTSHNFKSKSNITDAGILALENHLKRSGEIGKVSHLAEQPGFYKAQYLVGAKDRLAILLLPSVAAFQYEQFLSILLSRLKLTKTPTEVYATSLWKPLDRTTNNGPRVRFIDEADRDKFIKAALGQSKANIVMFVDSAFKPLKNDWADQLVGLVSQVSSVGVASPLIINQQEKLIADAGYIDRDGDSLALFQWLPVESNTYAGNTVWGRNINRPSNRLTIMRRAVYEKYFTGKYPRLNQGRAIYKKITDDGLEVVVTTNVMLDFQGGFNAPNSNTGYFNSNLLDLRRGISLPKTINVPPETEE